MSLPYSELCCRASVRADKVGTTLQLRVQPSSARSGPVSMFGAQVKWAVRAAASDGAANREVLDSLAEYFSLMRGAVEILSGQSARSKIVFLQGILPDQVLSILNN